MFNKFSSAAYARLTRPVSAVVDFVKAIQRDRLEGKISKALETGDTNEAFHRINDLTHDHGSDPQIPAFVFDALNKLESLPEAEGRRGSSAAYSTYAAIFYAPKGGDYQEKLIERFSRDYDANLRENFGPHYLDHHLYALHYAAEQSPAKLALVQKIIDTADTAPEPTWQQRREYMDEDYLFTRKQVLETLLKCAGVAGADTAQGQDALTKWNSHVDRIAEKDSGHALSIVCDTDSRYLEDRTRKNAVAAKAGALFESAVADKKNEEIIRYAPRVAYFSGQPDKIAATLHDLATQLENTDLPASMRAKAQEAHVLSPATPENPHATNEREQAAVAEWSRMYETLAQQDLYKARLAIVDTGQTHGLVRATALSKLPALADATAAAGNVWLALGIAKDAANLLDEPAQDGFSQWRRLVGELAKADITEALQFTFDESETYNGNSQALSMLAALTYVDLAAKLAQTDPAEGLRRLHTIAHDSAGGRDMFGSKHRESPMGPPATKKWAEIVTELAKTDPAAALKASREAVKYWDDKAPRDEGRIPGSMYKTAKSFVRRLERNQPAPTLSM